MNLSTIRLIASDMDGTLLNSKHELPKDFLDIFGRLRNKGIVFAAASGRQYHNIKNVFSAIADDVYFIAENGAYMVHRGADLLVQEMEPELTRSLIRDARRIEGTFIILCGKKKAYIENDTPFFVEHLKKFYDEYQLVPDLLEVTDDSFLKIAICDISGAEGNTYRFFQSRSDLQIKVSGNIWLDISHRLANKGKALNELQNILGVSPAETLVFGDYLNDVEMLQQADYSFAMENAHAEVKKVARFHTGTNDDNGVMRILTALLKD